MPVPSDRSPTEPESPEAQQRGRRRLSDLGAFRPFPTWISVCLALLAGAVILYLLSST